MNKRKIGTLYENMVCSFLEEKGMIILERNFVSKKGEIDIIAKDGTCTVFIEVKYRSNKQFGNPIEAVTENKKIRICQTAAYYCVKHREVKEIRYDVIGIMGNEIVWIPNAFNHRGYCFI